MFGLTIPFIVSHPPPLSCGLSMCWAAGPAGSSLLFHIIDNWPARGMEEWNSRANATLQLQLLLAATATGAENQTHRFVIISNGSRFPCVSLLNFFFSSVSSVFSFSFDDFIILRYGWAGVFSLSLAFQPNILSTLFVNTRAPGSSSPSFSTIHNFVSAWQSNNSAACSLQYM